MGRMASTIQVRVDDDLKMKLDKLFKDLGIDTTVAIRMFLTQTAKGLSEYVLKSRIYQLNSTVRHCEKKGKGVG